MAQHEKDHTTGTREREVIVTDSGRSGSGVAGVVAAVIGAIVVLLLAWLLFFNGTGDSGDIENPLPDEVDVNVDDGSGGGGS